MDPGRGKRAWEEDLRRKAGLRNATGIMLEERKKCAENVVYSVY